MLRIRVVYPGSRILIFTHPGSRIQKQEQKRGVKKNFCHTFIGSHKFHKFVNYFSFEVLKKKIWANFKNMGLGSGIRKKPIPDPGSRGQKGTESRIRIRNTVFFHVWISVADPWHFGTNPDRIRIRGSVPHTTDLRIRLRIRILLFCHWLTRSKN